MQDDWIGTRLGPYRIEAVVGEGSMGRVFGALESPSGRRVALKVLRTGELAETVEWRFQREIALLGALEHPHIARLYAAGQLDTPNGPRAYLAMEYVDGEPLDAALDRRKASLHERLNVMAEVARAVHHAHTRGVIHRDLKPANILVDAQGAPRVLDFGVAHVIREDSTRYTVTGEVLGTVPYMAPEQLSGDLAQLDPRSDVYALGVITYRLLAGVLPFAGIEQMTVIRALAAVLTQAPERLSRRAPQTRGDVETVVMKAMAREREQRYASAADFAADIERILAHQPIAARAPSLHYVLGLLMRRHRVAAAFAAASTLALVTATAVSLRLAVAEQQARAAAELRLAEREAVNEFLREMLASADPEHLLGGRLTVLNVVDIARTQLDGAGLSPGAEGQLRRTLGNTYSSLGRNEDARVELDLARLRLDAAGADRPDRLRLEIETAQALARAGQESEALARIEAVVAVLTADPDSDEVLGLLARFRQSAIEAQFGRVEAPEQRLAAVIEEAERQLGPDHRLTLEAQSQYTLLLNRVGRYAEGLERGRNVVERLRAQFGDAHPRALEAEEIMALNHREQGDFAAAATLFERTREIKLQRLGADHPQTLLATGNLALARALAGESDAAWPLIEAAYSGLLAQLGPEAEATVGMANYYAIVATERRDYAAALRVLEPLLTRARARPEGPLATDLIDFNNVGNNLLMLERYAEAEAVLAELLPLAARLLGEDHPFMSIFQVNHARALGGLGRRQEAIAKLDDAIAGLRAEFGEAHPRVKTAEGHRVRLAERSGAQRSQ